MDDWIQEILRCPDCGSDLSLSANDRICTATCGFIASGADLRPQQQRMTNIEMPVAHELNPEAELQRIDLSRPRITYHGPAAIRDSRELMSVIQELLRQPGRVLDLGCGPRDQELPICHLGHQYVGVDYWSTAAHLLADAHSLPFGNGAFDCVFSYAVLEHLYNPFIAIREIERVLVPGGVYVGTVSLGEPFHQSYFHHSAWGLISLLASTQKLELLRVWPALDTLSSLSQMGRYSRAIRALLGILDRVNTKVPFLTPRKMRWPIKDKQIDALHRCGAMAFVVSKRTA